MRKLLNRALALIYLARAMRHWIAGELHGRKAQRNGFGTLHDGYRSEIAHMQGDALADRAARLWDGRA